MDYYKILGLSSGATPDEIKAAYKALAQKYNPESYDAGPLRDEASQKMDELNEAFDALMGNLRTGSASTSYTNADTVSGQYDEIRKIINSGNPDDALVRLNAIPNGHDNAEWNFLSGSAYYYKGWMGDAVRYFEAACNIEPNNREYQAALRNLQNNARGNMNSNPYGNRQYQGNSAGCSCCDVCTAMMCMDMCCGCGRGC